MNNSPAASLPYPSPYLSPQVTIASTSEDPAQLSPTLRQPRQQPVADRNRARRLRERLSQRDLEILLMLHQQRLMTGHQLRRLFFAEGDNPVTQDRKARAVVQRLLRQKVIVRLERRIGGVHHGSDGQVVTLSGLGGSVLEVGGEIKRRQARVIDTKPAFQSHLLAIAELRVRLVEYHRGGRCQLREFAPEPDCHRRFSGIGGQTITLKPDAYLRLVLGNEDEERYEALAFIEQDMGTESSSTIENKLGVYIDYWRSGQEQQRTDGLFPLTWWLVPHKRRLEAIAAAIQGLPREVRHLFTVVLTAEAADQLIGLPKGGEHE